MWIQHQTIEILAIKRIVRIVSCQIKHDTESCMGNRRGSEREGKRLRP